jgi:hypothetical protein
MSFDSEYIRKTAEKFDRRDFKKKIREFVEKEYTEFKKQKSYGT